MDPNGFNYCGRHFRFTPLKTDQEQVGWEVHCKMPHTEDVRAKECRLSLRFSKHGGPEMLERKLKWWCLQAGSHGSRKGHHDLPVPHDKDLPSIEELNEPDAAIIQHFDMFAPRKRHRT